MLNLLRKFLKPTLREQLEDGVREALRKYADRNTAPSLRVYVSTDLVPTPTEAESWAESEGEHLRRFALQWAEDNSVPRAGLRLETILLDTKREFAFVKPVGLVDRSEEEPRRGRVEAAKPMVNARAPEAAILEVLDTPGSREPVEIRDEITIGRKAEGDSVISVGDRYMSGRHARFHMSGGALHVTDLDSKNRTFVNGNALTPHQPTELRPGDEIRLGTTTFRFARIR